MKQHKWGNPIPELGIKKLVPEVGCLMAPREGVLKGKLFLFSSTLDKDRDWTETYSLVLPRVPEDKTCWDVLELLSSCGSHEMSDRVRDDKHCVEGKYCIDDKFPREFMNIIQNEGYLHCILLEDGSINITNITNGPADPYRLVEDARDGVSILIWIEANEVKADG